jgi:hypothetical protein
MNIKIKSYMNQTKQPLDPKDRVLNISRKKSSGQFIFLSKIFLKKFEEVELHGLGEATKIVAQVAETLSRTVQYAHNDLGICHCC